MINNPTAVPTTEPATAAERFAPPSTIAVMTESSMLRADTGGRGRTLSREVRIRPARAQHA